MADLFFVIELAAPLALNDRKPGGSQYQEGMEYVPGRVVRGALADAVLRTCRDRLGGQNHADCPRPALCRAVLEGEARFGDALPTGGTGQVARLLPATALTCKNDGGFRNRRGGQHGVMDTLIDRACFEVSGQASLLYRPVCPACGGRMAAARGAYTVHEEASGEAQEGVDRSRRPRYYGRQVARELLVRVAINRRRGVAEDELLYAVTPIPAHTLDPQVLDEVCKPSPTQRLPPTRFSGRIWHGEEDVLAELATLVGGIGTLGSGRTRGLGRVSIRAIEGPTAVCVAGRLGAFDKLFRQRMGLYGGVGVDAHYFAITLESDCILTDEGLDGGWSPSQQLTPEMVWRACGEVGAPAADLELVRNYAAAKRRGGWNGLWGLRKESAQAVQAGSVYLYRVHDLAGWAERLTRLERTGVGERRAEGYGWVRVCDEFHTTAVGRSV